MVGEVEMQNGLVPYPGRSCARDLDSLTLKFSIRAVAQKVTGAYKDELNCLAGWAAFS